MAASSNVKMFTAIKWAKLALKGQPRNALACNKQSWLPKRSPIVSTVRCYCSDQQDSNNQEAKTQKVTSSKKKLNLAKPPGGISRKNLQQEEKTQGEETDDGSSSSSSSSDEEELASEISNAAKEAAKVLPGNAKKTHSELLARLQKHSARKKNNETSSLDIGNLLADLNKPPVRGDESEPGMSERPPRNGERRPRSEMSDRPRQGRGWEAKQGRSDRPAAKDGEMRPRFETSDRPRQGAGEKRMKMGKRGPGGDVQRKDKTPAKTHHLYEAKPIGIFSDKLSKEDGLVTEVIEPQSLFNILEQEELENIIHFPPSNAYQQEMQWIKEGKTWTFPVNNEYDAGEEENVGFHEHVFLSHLVTDFPKGPVRHFMELVATGLSKNPYMSVQEKHAHIAWYRQYFEDKQRLIEESVMSKEDDQASVEQ